MKKIAISKIILHLNLIFIIFVGHEILHAQQLSFAKFYYKYDIQEPFSFLELTDSGFIIVGYAQDFGSPEKYSFAIRINNAGDTIWTKRYNLPYNEIISIVHSDDSNLVLGSGFNKLGGSSMNLAKINLNGDAIFTREYGPVGGGVGGGGTVYNTADGGYIMLNAAAYDYGYIKLDFAFNVQWHTWQNILNGCGAFSRDVDNGYIAGGSGYYYYTIPGTPYVLQRFDSAGNIIWQYDYGNTLSTANDLKYISGLVVTADSNYIAGTNGPDWQLMKVNRNSGDTVWTRNYDTSITNYKYWVTCMDYGGNDNYIIGTQQYMMLVDNNGDSIWRRQSPFPTFFYPSAVHKTSDGGFAFCGRTLINNPSATNVIGFIKYDSLGNTVFTTVINLENNFQPLTIYPNPATDKLYINAGNMINEKKLLFTLTDIISDIKKLR